MRIGLLGGTFDPIHNAHVRLAQTAYQKLELNEVQLIPAGRPWQKPALQASSVHRAEMIRLAIADLEGLKLNTEELERAGTTYTIDTLESLPPEHTYFWILGTDQLTNFCSWHRWADIARRVTLLVAARPTIPFAIPEPLDALVKQGQAKVQVLPFEPMELSASQLRNSVSSGLAITGLVCKDVEAYIARHGLYSKPPIE
jgi:nicotinate-nucleotide adenylyltransferase